MSRIQVFVESYFFRRLILAAIVVGAVVIGLETYPAMESRYGYILHFIDRVVVGLFFLEATLKLLALWPRPDHYFRNGWNVFDFTVLALCILPTGANYFAVARLARVLRVFRVVSTMPRLQVLVSALLKSIPSMGYIGALLFLIFYIYAVVGVFLFGGNDPAHFLNLQRAFLTLFGVVTLEGWTEIMKVQMLGCNGLGLDIVPELCRTPQASPFLAPAYFISFVISGTMIILNLFIGVVVNSMSEAQKELRIGAKSAQVLEDLDNLGIKFDELKLELRRLLEKP